ncbi:tropomyosin [Thalictrum thalictroides]|uniref:Tropomyosin n=1 Tax=Thalictrum thalictroides TaxID=46969 RepID=A0A7J6VXP0_THATH|nr:tropomyosin [Thalictrum thalictroides]
MYSLQAHEQRVETLERELDAAITAAAHARSEKRQAEAGQRPAELRAQEVTAELDNTTSMLRAQEVAGELENTTKVFELHMEELRAKQEEISKRYRNIKVLEAIIQTISRKESHAG